MIIAYCCLHQKLKFVDSINLLESEIKKEINSNFILN